MLNEDKYIKELEKYEKKIRQNYLLRRLLLILWVIIMVLMIIREVY